MAPLVVRPHAGSVKSTDTQHLSERFGSAWQGRGVRGLGSLRTQRDSPDEYSREQARRDKKSRFHLYASYNAFAESPLLDLSYIRGRHDCDRMLDFALTILTNAKRQ